MVDVVRQRRVSVVMPTQARAEQAVRCVERLRQTARGYDLEVVAVADDDEVSAAALAPVADAVILTPGRVGPVAGWNLGAEVASGDVLVLGADDLWAFHGWVGEMLERMAEFPDGDGMVGFNDLAQDGDVLATHYAVSRRFAREHFGGVLVCPHYQSYYVDVEATARGKRAGRYTWAQNAVLEHRHWLWRKAACDGLYVERAPLMATDEALFRRRMLAGWPDDFERVLW